MQSLKTLCVTASLLVLTTVPLSAESPAPPETPPTAHDLQRDTARLKAFSSALEDMVAEMNTLQEDQGPIDRGFYTADESDRIKYLLFRYLVCRESLWELVHQYRDYETLFDDPEDQTRAFLLAFESAVHLAHYSSLLVETFVDHDAVIAKINEAYRPYDIPAGTYDQLFRSVTSVEHQQALKAAWILYARELEDTDSLLYQVTRNDPARLDRIGRLYQGAERQGRTILKKRSMWLPEVRNRLRHSVVTDLARKAERGTKSSLYAVRGFLFTHVSRLRTPTAEKLHLSDEEVQQIKQQLRPGDLVFTFSDGYMSNLFLPGVFKHGITYVGSPEQREAIGLDAESLPGLPEPRRRALAEHVGVRHLPCGSDADLVEAVAEGVIFNSLGKITDGHIARMVVLRPNLTPAHRVDALQTVLLLLGDEYDFHFNFDNSSYQCCTEVIYRSLHQRGPIAFDLVPRAGVQTLSADDIVTYHLTAKDAPFETVLFAEPGPKGARILVEKEGHARLVELMDLPGTE